MKSPADDVLCCESGPWRVYGWNDGISRVARYEHDGKQVASFEVPLPVRQQARHEWGSAWWWV